MEVNVYAMVLLFSFVQGVIYATLFVRRGAREERTSDYLLAALILAICIFNLPWMLGFMGIHVLGQEWWFLPQSVDLVIGPLMYFYLKSQINTNFKFNKAYYGHFAPYLGYFGYHLFLFLLGNEVVGWWDKRVHSPLHINDIENVAGIISASTYIILSWKLYQRYLAWLPDERSDMERVRFGWYRNFLWALAIGIVSAIVFFIAGFGIELSFWDIWVQRAGMAVIIYYISIAGYAQWQPHQLAFDPAIAPPIPIGHKTTAPGYKADFSDLEDWKNKIEQLMHQEHLYLQPDLSLSQLANLLNTHPAQISNAINAAFDKNFNDFVNAFRVTAFQEKVSDPKLQHLTLLAIAFECGFNSKSTFNRAVKKVTGQQPSDFLKRG